MTGNRPKTRTAILHVGQGKSGSSSIQHAIAGYDDGSAFHAAFRTSGGQFNHSNAIATAFSDDPLNINLWKALGFSEAEFQRERERYRAQFSAMLRRRDRDRIVISNDYIWAFKGTEKAELAAFIHEHGWEIRAIAYVREPASWTASMTSNRIRIGGQKDISRKLDQRYRRGLEPWAELLVPERLDVRAFDPGRFEGGPVGDFCRAAGLDLARLPDMNLLSRASGTTTLSRAKAFHRNRDLSLPAMKLLNRFNRSGILDRYDATVFTARQRLVHLIEEKYAGMGTLDPALCAGIADWSETEWLYETFGIDFRPKLPPPGSTAADLEAVLGDLSDVDISGLDELLTGYGIRHENFITAEEKLHRLFYAVLMEPVIGERNPLWKRLSHGAGKTEVAVNPGEVDKTGEIGRTPKNLRYRILKRLSKSRLLSTSRREKLARKAQENPGSRIGKTAP